MKTDPVSKEKQILPSIDIPSGKDYNVSVLMEQLKNGVCSLMNGDSYKRYLDFASTFYQYSFRNVLLIASQMPEASAIGSYDFWKSHGRHVRRGEHGLKILAPNVLNQRKESPILDSGYSFVRNKDGSIKTETKEVNYITGFRFSSVFDISQTDGEPLPSILTRLTGNTPVSGHLIDAVTKLSKLPVEYKTISGAANGYMDNQQIVIREGLSPDQTAKTLLHEYVHSEYHLQAANYLKERSTYEIQAESTSYIVSKHFGLDTSDYSFGYIASWARYKTVYDYQDSLKLVNNMSKNIIHSIEEIFKTELKQKHLLQQAKITQQIKSAGFIPTPQIISSIAYLNKLTGQENTLMQIKNLSAKKETDPRINNLAATISSTFRKQELERIASAEILQH